MQSTGQTSTQASQPVQLSASTTAISLKNFLRGFGDVVAPGVGIQHLGWRPGGRIIFHLHFTLAPDNGKAPQAAWLTQVAPSRIIPEWPARPSATPRATATTR